MKYLFLFCLATCTVSRVDGQAPVVRSGPVIELTEDEVNTIELHGVNGKPFALFKLDSDGRPRRNWSLARVDEQLNIAGRTDLMLPSATDQDVKFVGVVGMFPAGDHHKIFFGEGNRMCCAKLNATGRFDPQSVVLDTMHNLAYNFNYDSYGVATSFDSSMFVTFYTADAGPKEKKCLMAIKVYDEKLRSVYESGFELPYKYQYTSIRGVKLHNDGSVDVLVGHFKPQPTNQAIGQTSFHLVHVNASTKAVTDYKIPEPERMKEFSTGKLLADHLGGVYFAANGGGSSVDYDEMLIAKLNKDKAAFDAVVNKTPRKDFLTDKQFAGMKFATIEDIYLLDNGNLLLECKNYSNNILTEMKPDGSSVKATVVPGKDWSYVSERVGNTLCLFHNGMTADLTEDQKPTGNRPGAMLTLVDLNDLSHKTYWLSSNAWDKNTFPAFDPVGGVTVTKLDARTFLYKLELTSHTKKTQLATVTLPKP